MSWFKMFSAVLVANIVSWIIVSIIGWAIFFFFLSGFHDLIKQDLSSSPSLNAPTITLPSAPTQDEIQARIDRERQQAADRRRERADAQQRRSAIASTRESCDFWTKEYSQDRDPKSRAYRDMACTRLQSLLNR